MRWVYVRKSDCFLLWNILFGLFEVYPSLSWLPKKRLLDIGFACLYNVDFSTVVELAFVHAFFIDKLYGWMAWIQLCMFLWSYSKLQQVSMTYFCLVFKYYFGNSAKTTLNFGFRFMLFFENKTGLFFFKYFGFRPFLKNLALRLKFYFLWRKVSSAQCSGWWIIFCYRCVCKRRE